MALLEDCLVNFLRRSPGVVALTGDRIYPEQSAVGAAYPRVTYELAETVPAMTLSGDTRQPIERYSVYCWARADAATGYREARALAEAILDATGQAAAGGKRLREFAGWLPPKELPADEAVWVQAGWATEVRGGEPEQPPGGGPKPAHKITVELSFAYLKGV